MSVWAECYMRYNGVYEMSRDVGNMFLTLLDKVDDFIYRGHGVPEEFRGTFHIGGSAGGGQISSCGKILILGAARWDPWSHNAHWPSLDFP